MTWSSADLAVTSSVQWHIHLDGAGADHKEEEGWLLSWGRQSPSSVCPILHRHGYKQCLHVYLNRDGSGRGTHVSFFITLIKVEFDPSSLDPSSRQSPFHSWHRMGCYTVLQA